jgi:hypothetical protein
MGGVDAVAQTRPGAQARPDAPAQVRPDAPAQPRPDASTAPRSEAPAQPRQGPPHEWTFGSWTGGIFPAGDADTPACFGSPTVIFTRDIVMRVSVVDTAYRERTIETVAQTPTGLEFRFTAAAPVLGPMGARQAPDAGFGCPGGPNVLKIERRGPDELAFPGCAEFPATLKRCTASR